MAESKPKEEAKQEPSERKKDNAPTRVIICGCKHEYQDKRYGLGMRVHNFSKKKSQYSCTVCDRAKAA